MNLSRAVGYIIRNEQRRTERSQETVQEYTVRRSIRNEADNRRRPKRVCIRNDVEEHNCGTMSEQCCFFVGLFIGRKRKILPITIQNVAMMERFSYRHFLMHRNY
ncbi:hypothetical protein AVEN_122471-1 [Araneus ventricosus]|uniref:Uncharacterized protein n=1 Tax=Araneus ventricosus TaxID=182803 RepID=A0A4Y2KUJ7_ARAVE|nr:hypothetical protein AVEN_122471-1 [Araneus ventricosus]